MLAFQPVAQLIVSLITLWCAAYLRKIYLQKHTGLMLDFYRFFIFFGLFFFFLSVPGLASQFNPMVMGIGWMLAHICLYIGLALFTRIPSRLHYRQKKSRGFYWILAFGFLVILLNILNFNLPIFENGMIDWNINPLVGITSALLAGSIGVMIGFFFFKGAHHSNNSNVVHRSLLLSSGIWVVVIASIILYFAALKPESPSFQLLVLGNVIEVIGILLMFSSVRFFHQSSSTVMKKIKVDF